MPHAVNKMLIAVTYYHDNLTSGTFSVFISTVRPGGDLC